MRNCIIFLSLFFTLSASGQVITDSIQTYQADSVLRIINLNPYFNQHVDSSLLYVFEINKPAANYYWYLKNSPAGLKINKDNGLLTFKADKVYFLSGKLKYDYPYKVNIGVQNLHNSSERVDTNFILTFYNTEIIPSRVKPTVAASLTVDEGDTVSFRVQCETGNFPIDNILFSSSTPLKDFMMPSHCGDEFRWVPPYDFVKETDPDKVKNVYLLFIGSNKFNVKDTSTIRLIVREALNYPLVLEEYNRLNKTIRTYILQLKYSFLQSDKKLKKTKNTRSVFDLTSAATALTGTILNTSSSSTAQNTGKVLPSVGVALVPIKEATSPNKIVEQNQASLIRSSIKRLEYMLYDNQLTGEKDPAINNKTSKLKDELKQSQLQLIDVPIDMTTNMTEDELNNYFNSPKVNKKYRLKNK